MTRLLVINPNTSPEVTEAVVDTVCAVAPEAHVSGVTGRFGARIVTTEAENAIAAHAALDLAAVHAGMCDGVILGISFDSGLRALRDVLPVPVVGITEAAVAATGGRPWGAVLFGESARPLYLRLFSDYGPPPVSVEVVELASVADYLAPQDRDARVLAAVARLAGQGAEAVVICGAAIAGMAARLARDTPVPLYDAAASVPVLLDAIAAGGPFGGQPQVLGDSVGLPEALADLIAGRGRGG